MTNLQLCLTIGIPSLLVVLSWIQQGSRISRLEVSFESLDRKFEALRSEVHAEITTLRGELHREITGLRADLHRDMNSLRDELHRDMNTLRDSIHGDMVTLHERVAVVEAKHA